MCGEPVLAHARVAARREQVVAQPGLDHPPAEHALEANQAGNADEGSRRACGDAAAGDEVDCWEDKGEPDETAPESVRPLHPVDLFELGELHIWVQTRELGRGTVLGEFGVPVVGRERWQGAGYGPPVCDAQAGLGEPGQAAEDDDAENARGTAEEPVADGGARRRGKEAGLERVRRACSTLSG